MEQNIALVILAGGRGVRYGGKTPKQFLLKDGQPLFIHALKPFLKSCKGSLKEVVIVCPPSFVKNVTQKIRKGIKLSPRVSIVEGGSERISSIFNAIEHLISYSSGIDTVLIHDAVRPLTHPEDISGLVQYYYSENLDAAVLTKPVTESLFKKDNDRNTALNREHFVLGETPNIFKMSLLNRLYTKWVKKLDTFHPTLDIVELVSRERGLEIGGFDAKYPNIKLTYVHDMHIIKALWKKK